jgi:hypothetical protein
MLNKCLKHTLECQSGIIFISTYHFSLRAAIYQERCPQPIALTELSVMANSLPDNLSELVPPDPIPNSVVKRLSADGSVGVPM